MGRTFAGRSVRLPAGALLALLTWIVAAPSEVKAGCGSQAVHRSGVDPLARYLDPLVLGDADRTGVESAPPMRSERRGPCSGPSCSENSRPPAVPALSDVRSVEPWACLGPVVVLPVPESRSVAVASPAPHPLLTPAPIFHPPRRNVFRSSV